MPDYTQQNQTEQTKASTDVLNQQQESATDTGNKKPFIEKQRKQFFITQNSPDDYGMTPEIVIETIHSKFRKQGIIYFCFAFECGSNPHLHIFLILSKKKRWSAVQKAFPHAHVEAEVRGNPQQVVAYIKKEAANLSDEKKATKIEGTFYEEGTIPKFFISDSKTIMLEQINEMVNSGMKPEAIMEQHIAFRAYETIIKKQYYRKRFHETPPKRDIRFIYHVGDAGTGKSYTYVKLLEKYPDDVFITCDYSNRCTAMLDAYNSESIILLDNITPSSIPYQIFLTLTDGYRVQQHCRYSNVYMLHTEIHTTSVYPPELLFEEMVDITKRDIDSFEQLRRRITTVVYHYKKDGMYCTYEMPGNEYISYDDLKQKALADSEGFIPITDSEKQPFN